MFIPDKAADTSFLSHIPDLINAIVSLFWLTLACIAFWKFYGPLKSAIDSRSLSVDIGGFKLSFQEATEGLKKQVADLQAKVAQLEGSSSPSRAAYKENEQTELSRVPSPGPGEFTRLFPPAARESNTQDISPSAPIPSSPAPAPPAPATAQKNEATDQSGIQDYPGSRTAFPPTAAKDAPPPIASFPSRVLWVDDNPRNNAYEISNLQTAGTTVDTALSTAEGLSKYENGHYQAVITDMGRKEDGSYNGNAGLELIAAIRKLNHAIPIFVYSASSQVDRRKTQVATAGGNGITSSSVELYEMLRHSTR